MPEKSGCLRGDCCLHDVTKRRKMDGCMDELPNSFFILIISIFLHDILSIVFIIAELPHTLMSTKALILNQRKLRFVPLTLLL